jgi:hypothetical protein
MKLPEIPQTYIILTLLIGLIIMRIYGIDSFTTAALSLIIGWLTGVKMEQSRKC